MKNHRYSKYVAAVLGILMVGFGAVSLNQHVSAAAEGSISGTVKLSGTAPHMKGIDMSKDPFCSKAHANDQVAEDRRQAQTARNGHDP